MTPPPDVPDRTPAAFARLYDDEYLGLVRLAYLILGSREQAEEVVQDAFVRLHSRWTRVDNPGGYLRTSVVNGCRDVRRRLVRYRAREPRLAERAETWDTPDELSDAMAALPVRQRAVLVLRYYGGMSEAEIADTLSIRPGTVKSSIHRGLKRLRLELAPAPDTEREPRAVNDDADTVSPGVERCLAVHLEQRAAQVTAEPALGTVIARARRRALRRRVAAGAAIVTAVTVLAGAFRLARRRRGG